MAVRRAFTVNVHVQIVGILEDVDRCFNDMIKKVGNRNGISS